MKVRYSGWLFAGLMACTSSTDGANRDGGGVQDASTPRKDAGTSLMDASAGRDAAVDASTSMTKGRATVVGKVVNPAGYELGGIEVEVAGKRVRTDNRGIFRAGKLPEGMHQVTVVDARHSRAHARVMLKHDGTTQVSLTALEYKSVELADAMAGGTIAQDNLSITLPGKALRHKDGKMVSGKVEARYAIVNDVSTLTAAPGGMRAEMAGGEEGDLESFGMVDVAFYQGEEELSLDGEADMLLPLGTNGFAADADVEIWYFDETKGLWRSEGTAKVDKTAGGAGHAKLKVKHFSWWNIDQPITTKSCLVGKLLTADGAPVPDMRINGLGIDYLTNLSTTTADDGSFCMDVKLSSNTRLSSFALASGAYFSWELDALSGSTPATCGGDRASCVDVGSVMGASLFDECTGNVTSDENHVLVLSSGDMTLDANVRALLERYGNTVTVGPAFTAFDGMTSLDDYDVIYLQANSNWAAGDMPQAGQRQLINWVNCGGGLVTVEWTVWKSGTGQFALLDSVYPMIPATPYGSAATSTYVKVGDDPVVHHGLPDMFTFTADSFSGTEIDLSARPGATVFYDSQPRLEGVVGWDFNMGRVVSISTCAGSQSLADANYGRMLANIVDWLQRDAANEPTAE